MIFSLYNSLTNENKKYLLNNIDNIISSSGTDVLGNLFNSIIHGKFEAGEGLGSFLTPIVTYNNMNYETGDEQRVKRMFYSLVYYCDINPESITEEIEE